MIGTLLSAIVGVLFVLAPVLAIVALILIVRHGPVRSRWWRGENMAGFAVFVGAIAFVAGFVGPMLLTPGANQGPLLGIFFTGPAGLVVGLLWGALRAHARRAHGRETQRGVQPH